MGIFMESPNMLEIAYKIVECINCSLLHKNGNWDLIVPPVRSKFDLPFH